VDADGNAYVTGFTFSFDFPTTPGAFQRTFGDGGDALATKLIPTGTALVYSTLLISPEKVPTLRLKRDPGGLAA
jgi:hypothetical protein